MPLGRASRVLELGGPGMPPAPSLKMGSTRTASFRLQGFVLVWLETGYLRDFRVKQAPCKSASCCAMCGEGETWYRRCTLSAANSLWHSITSPEHMGLGLGVADCGGFKLLSLETQWPCNPPRGKCQTRNLFSDPEKSRKVDLRDLRA